MFSVALIIINFVFAFMAGVTLAAVFGFEWWPIIFALGFGLWNFVSIGSVFVIGFIFIKDLEGGE